MREYLDQKLLVLATKDDVEKLRQESKANLRPLREEVDLIREEAKEGLQKIRSEIQSTYDQANRAIDLSLQRFREEEAVPSYSMERRIQGGYRAVKGRDGSTSATGQTDGGGDCCIRWKD